MATEVDWLKAGFAEIWPAHMEGFVRLMLILRRTFDGDLDQMLILAVIGERKLARRASRAEPSYDRLGYSELRDPSSVAINPHSLADYTGIPRETVRRKVVALMARGWVERSENGDLRTTAKVAEDLQHGTEATLDYLRDLADAFDRVRAYATPRRRPGAANGQG
jgi:DNA-binding MarR family transcriptional regulator